MTNAEFQKHLEEMYEKFPIIAMSKKFSSLEDFTQAQPPLRGNNVAIF